eukprot:9322860-Prorocentrum_lima.AAC.1
MGVAAPSDAASYNLPAEALAENPEVAELVQTPAFAKYVEVHQAVRARSGSPPVSVTSGSTSSDTKTPTLHPEEAMGEGMEVDASAVAEQCWEAASKGRPPCRQ